jgi:amphi-Trp domain-containing protein
MARSTKDFEHESLQDRESIVKYLEALQKGFLNGSLLFCNGKKELVLRPRGMLNFTVKARKKGGRVRVAFEVDWKEPTDGASTHEPLEILPESGPDEE